MIKIYLTKKIDGQELPVSDFKIGLNLGQRGRDGEVPDGIVIDPDYVHTDNNYDDAAVEEVAKIAGKANSADVYTKSETYTKTEINNKLSAVYKFKGSVLTYDLLPTDAENADVWNVVNGITPELNGMNYAWNSTLSEWDAIGGIVGLATLTENGLMSKEDFKKLSDLYTKEDLDLILANKSDVGHNHSGETINPDAIVLDKAYTDAEMVALPVGAIFYNIDQLCWLLKLSAVNYYNFGEELPMLSMIGDDQNHLEGQAGYISGGQAGINKISLASSATGKINCLATQDVINTGNKRGYYAYFGQVRHFPYSNVIKSTDNENTWVDGADLFLSSEAGRYTTTQEDAPAKSSYIGRITNRQGANITVMFAPHPSSSVEDLSNVDGAATTVASGDSFFLKVGNLWKTITESNFLSWFRGLSHTWSLIQDFAAGLKTDSITKRNGSGLYKLQDGGTEWYTTKWFTPTGTFSSVGVNVTTTGGQLTAAMVGAKIGVGEDKRVITAFINSNQCTVDSAYSKDYSGIAGGSWGVYNRFSYYLGGQLIINPQTGGTFYNAIISLGFNNIIGGLIDNGAIFKLDNAGFYIKGFRSTANGFYNGTVDVAFERSAAGLYEINNGTAGTLRDLKLRSLYGDKIIPNSDGSTAIQITKADGTTAIFTINTTTGYLTSSGSGISGNGYTFSSSIIHGLINGLMSIGNTSSGSDSATAFKSKNIEFLRGLPDQSIRTVAGKYIYNDASPTADTINDIRTSNQSGVFTVEKCTVASATKGGGTWVVTGTIG